MAALTEKTALQIAVLRETAGGIEKVVQQRPRISCGMEWAKARLATVLGVPRILPGKDGWYM